MRAPMVKSRCSEDRLLDFYWWGSVPSGDAPIDAAVAEFASFMRGGDLVWSMMAWTMAVTEFRMRLRAAKKGQLKPVDQVKQLSSASPVEMLYEIRWKFAVLARIAGEGDAPAIDEERTVHVRLYHSEPVEHESAFVGLHVHEKRVVAGDSDETNRLQNAEIDVAVARFWEGAKSQWGIPQ